MRAGWDTVSSDEMRQLMAYLAEEAEPISHCSIWQLPDGSKWYLMRSGSDCCVASDLAIPTITT